MNWVNDMEPPWATRAAQLITRPCPALGIRPSCNRIRGSGTAKRYTKNRRQISLILQSELLEIHVGTLFVTDSHGDLVSINEPWEDKPRAPQIFVAWNDAEYICRFRGDVSNDKRRKIRKYLEDQSLSLSTQLPCAEEIETILSTECAGGGPAYFCPNLAELRGEAVRVDSENAEVLNAHLESWIDGIDCCQPCLVVLEDRNAVSICGVVRRSRDAAEAGLHTSEQHRRRGYAVAVTSAWILSVRAEGRIPMYSTSWANLASQGVADRVGLSQYAGDYWAG